MNTKLNALTVYKLLMHITVYKLLTLINQVLQGNGNRV
jgi:hypothetical protein